MLMRIETQVMKIRITEAVWGEKEMLEENENKVKQQRFRLMMTKRAKEVRRTRTIWNVQHKAKFAVIVNNTYLVQLSVYL